MLERLKVIVRSIRAWTGGRAARLASAAATVAGNGTALAASGVARARGALVAVAVLGGAAYLLQAYPPVRSGLAALPRSPPWSRANRQPSFLRKAT